MKFFIIILALILASGIVYSHDTPCNTTEENTAIQNTTEETALPEGMCNIALDLKTNTLYSKNKEKIEIYNNLTNKDYSFIIEYWIEDQDKNIIKDKIETNNLNKKQFTPNLKESQNITIKNNLKSIGCININNKTSNELSIFIEVEKSPEPYFKLEKLHIKRNRKIETGNNLTATVSAYTGNLTNMTINYQIENITNISIHNIIGQYNESTFNLTLAVPQDCLIEEKDYNLTLEALNKNITEIISIVNTCQAEESETTVDYEENTTITELGSEDESIINSSTSQMAGSIVYESKNEKAKDIASYIGMAVMLAVTIAGLFSSKSTEKTLKKTTEQWSSPLEQQ